MLDPDRRQIVLDALRDDELSDRQLVDVLLMIVDDHTITQAIMQHLGRRGPEQKSKLVQVNVTTGNIDKKIQNR